MHVPFACDNIGTRLRFAAAELRLGRRLEEQVEAARTCPVDIHLGEEEDDKGLEEGRDPAVEWRPWSTVEEDKITAEGGIDTEERSDPDRQKREEDMKEEEEDTIVAQVLVMRIARRRKQGQGVKENG